MVFIVKPFHVLAWLFCLACLGEARAAEKNAGHPIEKVINMLKEMQADSIRGGQQEEATYQKFAYWCSTSIKELQNAVADEKEQIAESEETLSGRSIENNTLVEEIRTLREQVLEVEGSDVDAKDQREEGEKAYNRKMLKLEETIDAVDAALKALTSAEQSTEPKMMFAQRHAKKVLALVGLGASITDAQMSQLRAIADLKEETSRSQKPREAAEGRPDLAAEGGSSAHVDKYDFKSESVVELMKQLKINFQADKLATIKAETNSRDAFDFAHQARQLVIKAAENSATKKGDERARVEGIIGDTRKSLNNLNDDLEVDSKTLRDTRQECSTKSEEWTHRSEVRDNEIKAMDAAITILAKATGVRTKAPGNPIPPPSPVAFLQVESMSNPRMSALTVLHEAARVTHSRALERLAVEIQAHLSGPFNQLNNMIEKMLFSLMDEQKQEDDHKMWCDHELGKTMDMERNKKQTLADLKATIKVEKGKIATLTEDIVKDDKIIADIIKFMNDATEVRQTGHEENRLAIKDAEAAQKALLNAIAVLTNFYKQSGAIPKEPWEFIQAGKDVNLGKNPGTWNAEYKGVGEKEGQPGGMISVLEAVMSDFAAMEADSRSQEAVDLKEHDQSMYDSKVEKARRTTESEMKAKEKKMRAEKVATLQSRVANTDAELETTQLYLNDLRPACVKGDDDSGDSSYENRKRARSKEIEALRKAQAILSDANQALDDKKKASSFLQVKQHF